MPDTYSKRTGDIRITSLRDEIEHFLDDSLQTEASNAEIRAALRAIARSPWMADPSPPEVALRRLMGAALDADDMAEYNRLRVVTEMEKTPDGGWVPVYDEAVTS